MADNGSRMPTTAWQQPAPSSAWSSTASTSTTSEPQPRHCPASRTCGSIRLQPGFTLVDYVEQHSRVNADELAYRYIDYSRERDGEALELTWEQFGVRLRAVAARLQQVTKRGDRVAILAPQGLDYVISFFAAIQAGSIAVPLFDRSSSGTERLCVSNTRTRRSVCPGF